MWHGGIILELHRCSLKRHQRPNMKKQTEPDGFRHQSVLRSFRETASAPRSLWGSGQQLARFVLPALDIAAGGPLHHDN